MKLPKRSLMARQYAFNSWKDFSERNISIGTMLHNTTGTWRFVKPVYEDKIPACQNACPAGNDIEGWIRLLQKGEEEKAYWHLRREQPFPSILGRVCFKFCENRCNRNILDATVGIKELERYVGDLFPQQTPYPHLPPYHGKSIAVVGSGPAGMSAAYYGRVLGFHVTIFESLPFLGGVLRTGIPNYRLPRGIVDLQFQEFKDMGIELRPETGVGEKVFLKQLLRDYDYLFLATGLHRSFDLKVKGEGFGPGIISGLEMLGKIAGGESPGLGRHVAVIGGGNTAIDAARSAVRLGCHVTVIYRRGETEMPAHAEEVEEARQEGVEFRFLAAPEGIDCSRDGRISGLRCSEMELGEPDESGRRRPLRKECPGFELKAETIIKAVGEGPEFEYLGGLVNPDELTAGLEKGLQPELEDGDAGKIFGGGDISGPDHTVVHAVASGKRGAIAIDCDRRGVILEDVLNHIRIGNGHALSFSSYMGWKPVNRVRQDPHAVVDSKRMVYEYFEKAPQVTIESLDPSVRITSFEPYRSTYSSDEAFYEASRCMHCGRCTECDNCLIFCPDISVLCRDEGEFGYYIDYDYCKGCGICFAECPRNAISMVDEEEEMGEED